MNITILGLKCRVEIIVLCIVVGFVIASFTICSCAKVSPESCKKVLDESKDVITEGFRKISDIADAASLNYHMNADQNGSWSQKALGYAGDMGYNTVLASHANYKGTEVPLQDTKVFFKNNAFKPECCPSTYTSSTGCACTSVAQLNYLNQRGGNRTLASEF
tara:strand:- start:782 stop:1267 length:486 start_codon:yes stop_codon:yes gene_type:complete